MTSLAARVKQYHQSTQKQSDAIDLDRYRKMPLEELAKEKITFGTAQLNKTFGEVFKDHKWTDGFTGRYEKSNKPAHRAYLIFVERTLDQDLPTTMTQGYLKTNKGKEKHPSPPSSECDPVEAAEAEIEFQNPGLIFDMEERLLHLQEANVNVNSRLTSVEMTMTEILQAVRNLSVKSEP